MDEKLMVSIIVPVYNAEASIEKCIYSILKQSYKNLEIIVINDGSTDNSLNKLKELESADKRIKVVTKENEGVSVTRNLGVQIACGDYVMFIDNDDFVEENYVETFFNGIHSDRLNIVIGGYKRVTLEGKVSFSDFPRDAKWGKFVILAPWAKIFDLKFLRSNQIIFLDYPIGEDVYFNISAFSKTTRIKAIDYIGYNWVYNETSISNTGQKGFDSTIDIIFLYEKLREVFSKQDSLYFKYFIKRYYIWYLLFNGRSSSSLIFLKQHERITRWIADEKLTNHLNPMSKKLSGEGYKNRIIVLIFIILEKGHLLSLFSKIYCKGNKK